MVESPPTRTLPQILSEMGNHHETTAGLSTTVAAATCAQDDSAFQELRWSHRLCGSINPQMLRPLGRDSSASIHILPCER